MHPARTLKLVVTGPNEIEIDLGDMQDLKDGVFNFKQLVVDDKIKRHNPIVVKFPGNNEPPPQQQEQQQS
jgi:hypothetical protein